MGYDPKDIKFASVSECGVEGSFEINKNTYMKINLGTGRVESYKINGHDIDFYSIKAEKNKKLTSRVSSGLHPSSHIIEEQMDEYDSKFL